MFAASVTECVAIMSRRSSRDRTHRPATVASDRASPPRSHEAPRRLLGPELNGTAEHAPSTPVLALTRREPGGTQIAARKYLGDGRISRDEAFVDIEA